MIRLVIISELHVSYFDIDCFFFLSTTTPNHYTLSLHDALPISEARAIQLMQDAAVRVVDRFLLQVAELFVETLREIDRKSTRLNSSHLVISYAVFCLKKKKNTNIKYLLVESIYDIV